MTACVAPRSIPATVRGGNGVYVYPRPTLIAVALLHTDARTGLFAKRSHCGGLMQLKNWMALDARGITNSSRSRVRSSLREVVREEKKRLPAHRGGGRRTHGDSVDVLSSLWP